MKYGLAFTRTFDQSLPNELDVSVTVLNNEKRKKIEGLRSIWDTGATGTSIHVEVAQELELVQIGFQTNYGVNGVSQDPTYLVDIELPNKAVIKNVQVSAMNWGATSKKKFGYDVLIGMDIINLGDFAVTANKEGKTIMSFRVPRIKTLDFVKSIEAKKAQDEKKSIGRKTQRKKK